MTPPRAAIVAAKRTPIGSFLGSLQSLSAVQLGSVVIRRLIESSGLAPEQVDEVLMGQVYTGGAGPNPARMAALEAGLPHSSTASTLNMVCGSGLRSVCLAVQQIQTGAAQCVIAGGQESMSNAPFVAPHMRTGQKMGHATLVDTLLKDALWDATYDCHMGQTAENLAAAYSISRAEQDAYAARSQQLCQQARSEKRFDAEMAPVSIPQRKSVPLTVSADEYPRDGVTPESLADLRPAFCEEGSVTAGNASGINDGAAGVMLMSEDTCRESGIQPLAWVRAHACAGVDPRIMGIGPAPAIRRALEIAGLSLADIGLLEVNEAFAAQILAVERELKWDRERLNINGGAIALGHPVGASGARILVTLLNAMQDRDEELGLASLCIGGGMGIAMIVERN